MKKAALTELKCHIKGIISSLLLGLYTHAEYGEYASAA
jgi:hypothetical protein